MSRCRKCGCELGEMDDCCPGCLAPLDKRKASTMALLGLRYEPEPKLTPPDAEPEINPEWVKSLEAERDALRVEYEIRRDWIANLCGIIGYDNSDGKHSEPDPFQIATELKRLATIGKSWETDSSLAKWFPFTFEALRAVVDAIDRYISAAGYNEHTAILTKARAAIVNSNFGLTPPH